MISIDRYLELPGARLRYRDAGNGAAVVLVHGWTLDLEIWEPQAELAAGFRLLRYDRRGFGLSSGKPSLAADVEDLRALISELSVDSPLLVGMSQGARVVLEFAARYPDIARALLLDGPPPIGRGDVPIPEFRAIAAASGMGAFRATWRAHPLTQLVTGDAQIRELLDTVLARYPGNDLLAPAEVPRAALDAAALKRIQGPVLIVNGELDTESRRRAGLELREASAAEHRFIHRAAHMPNLDAPREYNEIVKNFACRHLPAAA